MEWNHLSPSPINSFMPFWQSISKNWIVAIVNKFTVILTTSSVAILLWRLRQLPPQVPLWYQRPWGQDQLASPYWLILLPAGSTAIYLINVIASTFLTRDHLVFSQILFLTSLLVSFLSFITLAKIIFLVS